MRRNNSMKITPSPARTSSTTMSSASTLTKGNNNDDAELESLRNWEHDESTQRRIDISQKTTTKTATIKQQ